MNKYPAYQMLCFDDLRLLPQLHQELPPRFLICCTACSQLSPVKISFESSSTKIEKNIAQCFFLVPCFGGSHLITLSDKF